MPRNSEELTPTLPTYSAGASCADGTVVEIVLLEEGTTTFALSKDGEIVTAYSLDLHSGGKLLPIPSTNNLIRHGAVLLPGRPEPYEDVGTLLAEIRAYIRRYVDLSPDFLAVASAYVLFSWVHDAFNELPYLRFRGEFGSGKTRALTVVGSLLYKAFIASGASTVSPIFYTLDTFQGSLVIDEADFRFSDKDADIVKILNNGNVKGFPVLRQTMNQKREFDPRAFHVFGPKIVGMRHAFEDQALESRFLTEGDVEITLLYDPPNPPSPSDSSGNGSPPHSPQGGGGMATKPQGFVAPRCLIARVVALDVQIEVQQRLVGGQQFRLMDQRRCQDQSVRRVG